MKVRPGESELRRCVQQAPSAVDFWQIRPGCSCRAQSSPQSGGNGSASSQEAEAHHRSQRRCSSACREWASAGGCCLSLTLNTFAGAMLQVNLQALYELTLLMRRGACGAVRAEDMVACCGGSIECIRRQCPYSRGISRQVSGALTGMCWAFQRDNSKLYSADP